MRLPCVLTRAFSTSTHFLNTETASKASNPPPKVFTISYTPKHLPSYPSSLILADKYHPLYYRTRARYLAYPRDTLWLRISCNNLVALKRVVRAHCQKRLKAAIIQALRDAGFDSQGRALKATDESNHKVTSLVGTFQVLGSRELLEADSEVIKEQARSAVEKVITSYEKSLAKGKASPNLKK